MGSTIPELIVENIRSTLVEMQTTAGFNFDWKHVYKYLHSETVPDTPSALIETDEATGEPKAYPIWQGTLPVTVHGMHQCPHTEDDDPGAVGFGMAGDVWRGMMADVTRGGNAYDTRLIGFDVLYPFPGWVYCVVRFEIDFQARLDDPQSTRN